MLNEPANDEALKKRSVVIAGHRTSVSLESAFWDGLREIAEERGVSINGVVQEIDAGRATNLSSAIRVYVLNHIRVRLARLKNQTI